MKNLDPRTKVIFEGIAWSIAFTGVVAIAFAIFTQHIEPVEKFKVVDSYGECSVIRYTDPTNRWHYLLKCP